MSKSAAVRAPRQPSLAEQLDFRRLAMRDKTFIPIGRMITIRLGVDDNAAYFQEQVRTKLVPITQKQGLILDWGKDGPQMAQCARDRDVYVFPRGIHRPPAIKDPVIGSFHAPTIKQDLGHYSSGVVTGRDGTTFIVLQPVEQVVVLVGGAGMLIMNGRTHPIDGTKCAMLINPQTWEGHIVQGLLTFD